MNRKFSGVPRIFRAAILLLVFFIALGGCGRREVRPQKPLEEIRFSQGVHSVFYAPHYVALAAGFFEEEGLDLKVRTAWGSDKGAAAVLSGKADIALAGPEPAIYVHTQGVGNPLKIFAQLTARDGSFLLVRGPVDDSFSWSDLRGKTVLGSRPGGLPEMVLEYVLLKEGLRPHADVKITTNLAFLAVPEAFKEGKGDYVTLFEPMASMLELERIGSVVASLGIEAGPLPYTVYLATSDYINDRPDLIQAFTNAAYRGMLWVEAHPATDIAEVVGPFFPEISRNALVRVIDRYKKQGTWVPVPAVNPEHFANLQEIMITGRMLRERDRVPFDDVIINDFAKKAMASVRLEEPGKPGSEETSTP